MTETTNDTLLKHVLALQKSIVDQNVLIATTASAVVGLRRESNDRHRDNQTEIGKIRAGVAEANVVATRIAAELKSVKADVGIMKPVVRRMRARELVRRGIVECLGRWRSLFVAFGVVVGGALAWLNDAWPKVAAILRKLGAPVGLVLAVRGLLEAAADPFAPMLVRAYLAGGVLAIAALLFNGGARL